MYSERRRSLVELSNAAGPLSPSEVGAVVAAVCRIRPGDGVEPLRTELRPEEVWLDRAGAAHLAADVLPTVPEIGVLLEQLLAGIRRAGPARFPPGLVMIAARASGKIDVAPFPSCEALARALARFEPPDAAAALRALFERANGALECGSDYEYQRPVVAIEIPPSARSARPPLSTRWRRRGVFAAAAVLAVLAGVAAGVLFTPRVRSARITDATEVIVQPPAGDMQTRSASKPPIARRPAPAARRRGDLGKPQPLVDPIQAASNKVFSPSFDQSGSAIFFHAETARGSALKRAAPGENGVLHVLTIVDDAAKNYHVQLSPDGRLVAFDSDRDGVRGVYVARADGHEVRRISGDGYAAVPTWSPDGRRLAFLRAESDRPQVWNLWIAELASGDMTRLTNHRYGQVWGGAWFPDGRRLAYSHEDELILFELATGRTARYHSPVKGRLLRTPAVSPDGRLIIFQVFRDGAWLLNLDDESMRRVLDDASAEEFTWAPDGNRVAFHSRRRGDWGLWVMATP